MGISFSDVSDAMQRIKGVVKTTPIISNERLNELTGGEIFIKPECLQVTGSFKFRGAYHRLSQLSDREKKAGVVAWSSGNHAQGIAAAASLLGINAAIVMPKDAPAIKVENTQAYGAEIVFYDRYTQSREEIGHALSKERGAVLVPSYDDPHIIAGQGTTGLEFFEQLTTLNISIDTLLVCCGGGGLIAGIATAFSQLSPTTEIYSVEPIAFNDTERSLKSGNREVNDEDARSICDALLAPQPGFMTFPINQALLKGGLSVTDDDVKQAMRFAFKELKLVAEPGGAVALASVLSQKIDVRNKKIGVIISGGNVDPELFANIINVNPK